MPKDLSKEELNAFLNSCTNVKNDLQTVVIALRRKQLGSQQCAKATIEIIRAVLVQGKFHSTEQTMAVIKATGKELISSAPSELTIGNLVRRILFFIREEYANQTRLATESPMPEPPIRSRTSSRDVSSSGKMSTPTRVVSINASNSRRDRSGSNLSVCSTGSIDHTGTSDSPVVPFPQVVSKPPPAKPVMNRSVSSSGNLQDHMPTLETLLSQLDLGGSGTEDFSRQFPRLKASVLDAINDLSNEIDNTAAVCQRAKDYVHMDECILTYGYSRIVELFLKAAGAKRRFQLIIAESAPSLDGHKLALALSKVSSINVTLIPDSNIYAIMSRVNKVIIAPHAVMADGGAICSSGHHMVAVAAAEFAVPVVGVSGAFTFTPLFAHNQSHVLNELLSPANVVDYDSNVDLTNVLVVNPAFDFVPPDLVDLYVTNDGSSLPSYVYRQLSEYYHPKDYVL